MNAWLETHPTEVVGSSYSSHSINTQIQVLADWNHFYNYSQKLHGDTQHRIETTFGNKLCSRVNDFTSITLNWAMQQHCQVIVVRSEVCEMSHEQISQCYHDSSYTQASWAYPGNAIISPWANTDNLTDLIHYLTNHIQNRPTDAFYVFQGIRTESTQVRLFHACIRKCITGHSPALRVIAIEISRERNDTVH